MADDNDDKPGAAAADLEAEVAELKERLLAESVRATAAEQTARTATARVANADTRVQQSELQIVATAIETLTSQGNTLEAQYEQAAAEGNHRLMGSISRQMGRVEGQLIALESGKQRLEIEQEQASRRPAVVQPVAGESPAEFLAKQLPPRAAAWIRRNPEFAEGRNYQKMLGAHNVFIADNPGTEETDDYFKGVESLLGFVDGRPPGRTRPATNGHDTDAERPMSSAATGRDRQAADVSAPAAPPSRGGNSSRTVRLTAEQREAAAASGLSEAEYAENLQSLRKDGRIH